MNERTRCIVVIRVFGMGIAPLHLFGSFTPSIGNILAATLRVNNQREIGFAISRCFLNSFRNGGYFHRLRECPDDDFWRTVILLGFVINFSDFFLNSLFALHGRRNFSVRKARYLERDTPKNFSIPEVETWRPIILDASTLAETSV